jgi:hypothetical protein
MGQHHLFKLIIHLAITRTYRHEVNTDPVNLALQDSRTQGPGLESCVRILFEV